MSKRLLNIYGISNSHSQSGAYALILSEPKSNKRIPIIIGGFEAQAIAMSLEGIEPSRPLTHDLLKNLIDTLNLKLQEVFISQFHEGVFYSQLIFTDDDGKTINLDSRTSDAVALAVRFKCPIFADNEVVEKTAIVMEAESKSEQKEEKPEEEKTKTSISDYSMEELQDILNKAIEAEDFEYAAKLHKEIKKRKDEKE